MEKRAWNKWRGFTEIQKETQLNNKEIQEIIQVRNDRHIWIDEYVYV